MKETEFDVVNRAIARLAERNVFIKEERVYEICSLSPSNKRPIFQDPRWQKKEAYVVGEDPKGNLYLRMCDGTVRYWNQQTGSDEIIAPSVRFFVSSLQAPKSKV